MPSALASYRALPPALAKAIDELAVSVVDDLANANPRVRRWRAVWTRNTKANLAASVMRGLEDDAAEAFKDCL
jgi:hypothetical protein